MATQSTINSSDPLLRREQENIFIRAPKISQLGKGIKILATYKKQPVMITNGRHFATTFHPEIGDDYRIHEHIIDRINE